MRLLAYHRYVRRTAIGLMLLAALAFVQQGAMISASQAAAWAGFLPDPAVELSGPIHFHDQLAQHVHVHSGDNAAGHTHQHATHDPDDTDDVGPLWSVGCFVALMPTMDGCAALMGVVGELHAMLQTRPAGDEPKGLTRPPSTPSIA